MAIFKKIIRNNSEEYLKFSVKLIIIIFFLLIIWFLYLQLNIIKILFFSSFLLLLFSPFLNKMNKRNIPDVLAIFIIYLFFIFFLLISFFSIIPIFIKQTYLLIDFLNNKIQFLDTAYNNWWINSLWLDNTFLKYILPYIDNLDLETILDTLKNNFSSISQFVATNLWNIASTSTGFLFSLWNIIFQIVMIFIFNFFMVLERKNIKNFFYDVIPWKISKYLISRETKIITSLYEWLKWQLKLWIIMFFIVYISLSILSLFWIDLENNFTLALIAWLMEFIPYLWPILALLPALAIAAWLWLNAAVIVLVLYLVIQWCENNILVPYIMSKTLDLSPFLVLLMMAIWASTAWIIWIILAVPVSSIIQIFVRDFIRHKKKKD